MTDDRNSFYLASGIWNYKIGDRIYEAANTRNEYHRNLKNNANTVIIKLQGKKSYFAHSNINNYNTWHETNILHRNLLLEYKKFKIYNVLRIQHNLFKNVDESIINKKRFHSIPKLDNLPEINTYYNEISLDSCSQSCQQITVNPIFKPEFVNNIISDFSNIKGSYHCSNPFFKSCSWKVYRCQFNTQEESCCCSCNSDAMFEVMKSLYDCYKKKNCDNCNCILCGHLPREERRLGKLRKSGVGLASVAVGEKYKGTIAPEKALLPKVSGATAPPEAKVEVSPEQFRKAKAAGLLTPLEGKTPEQKEQILRGLAMQGIPLPEAKTASEKSLINKVRADVGLPPKPKTPSAKEKYNKAMAAGLITPLEGKSAAGKEDILRGQVKMGLPLPEGRTPSEKALIAKIRATAPPKAEVRVPSENLRKAKGAGLLTSLEGKRPEEKEKIFRDMAMQGVPLPEPKTASEKKLIDRVRTDVGLPPEPNTPSAKKIYNRAIAAGLITPLEGKSAGKKEEILREQAKMGISLPEGRTASEKAIINIIKTSAPLLVAPPPPKQVQVTSRPALHPENIIKLDKKTAKLMKEKKGPSDECICNLLTPESKREPIGIKLIEEPTKKEIPTYKSPSEKLRQAKAAGLMTPLEGKRPEQKVKILKGLAVLGIPLPEAKTASEKKLMDRVRTDVGLPLEPKTPSAKKKYNRAMAAGLITPLEGKSAAKKEEILRGQAKMGLPLPEGRTPSEKALVAKVRATASPESKGRIPSEKLRKAKAAGLLTPLEGKRSEQKENILRGLAMQGIPLPEPKTASEKKLMDRVRADVGLPPEPKTSSAKEQYNRAMAAGLITPLEGKSAAGKEDILRGQAKMGLPLPEGRTPSEKALIAKIRATTPPKAKIRIPSEKLRKAKAAGLLMPLEGKRPEQKEKILRGLAMQGIPLPEPKTASEKKLMDRVRADVGLPPEPKTSSAKEQYNRAMAAGLITPLEGKSAAGKEDILRGQAKMGLPLPEGRTPSEKALTAKIRATTPPKAKIRIPSEKLRKAKAAGLLTPLEGKRPEQKEKILRGLAMQGIPLPEPKTASEKKLMDRVRADVGLPSEPKTPSAKEKYKRAMAAGLITPLEGKSAAKKEEILREQAKIGLPLPEGRTPSEKALIAKIRATAPPEAKLRIPSEKLRKAKAAGLLTPLEGKRPEQKEKILKGLALQGIPLPKAKTASEKKLIDRVRADVGLPLEPRSPSAREKYNRAMEAGLITPLERKSAARKEDILRGQAKMGLPLPEGRTTSEKALIAKVKGIAPPLAESPEPKKRVKGRPALSQGKLKKLDKKTAKFMKEKKGPSDECICDLLTAVPKHPLIKTEKEPTKQDFPPYKIPSEKVFRAKAAGLLTPLEGKRPEQKEQILRGLAMQGVPLPEAKTASEKKLMDRVRVNVGLPPEPKTPFTKEQYNRAMAAGLITPLEGKSAAKKEEILREQAKIGLPLPEGRTPSEKALIAKVRATAPLIAKVRVPSEKLRKAKAAGLLTPLEGKRPEQKEKILRGLAIQGIPLPEPKTVSEKNLIDRVRADVGLPLEPKTPSAKKKYNRAMAAGLITPLEGKSAAKKEEILRGQAKMGLPLPEGRTLSEKALIAKIRATAPPEAKLRVPSEKLRKAKAAGLLTPLEGKRPEQKEKILKGLALQGIPLPKAKTASEKKLIDRVRADVGLPLEPRTPSAKEKYNTAMEAGYITPLEGKSAAKKEDILRGQAKMGLPLPEGRTPSEKALIAKIRASTQPEAEARIHSEKLRKAKDAGLLTPLGDKKPEEKEKILRGLAMQGVPLSEPKTASEKKLMDRVRADVGLPPEPTTPLTKEKYNRAIAAGLITPLEEKSAAKKEKILRDKAKMGLPLPEGRTLSEKALIAKIKATVPLEAELLPPKKSVTGHPAMVPEKLRKLDKKTAKIIKEKKGPSDECICDLLTLETEREIVGISVSKPPLKTIIPTHKISSEKVRKAQAEGLLTPLEGKKPKEKERILKQLALKGIPLPEAKSASEKKIIDKVRTKVGLPPIPKEPSAKKKYEKALADGIITPLEGKSTARKKEILHSQAKRGLSLPQGRTQSEKAIIAKVKATLSSEKGISLKTDYGLPIKATTPSEKELVKTAKAEGLLTPLKGKTSMQKEKILSGLAEAGLPMPEGATPSEKALVQKVRIMAGLPPELTHSEKKGMIKKKSKKVGIVPVHKSVKGVGVAKSKGGINEEFQDIIKTTTCDRGCGCDKKKIRFKHSYVKIKVTSPDISSLCPCPEECVPGVKGGVFTDNEGIKVTIGRITDIPSFTPRKIRKIFRKIKMYGPFSDSHLTVSSRNMNDIDNYSPSYIYSCDIITKQKNNNSGLQSKTYASELSNFDLNDKIIFIKSFGDHYENSRTSSSVSRGKFCKSDTSISSNLESVDLMKTDSSISLNTSSSPYSIISFSLSETASCSEYCVQDCLRPNEYYKIKKQNICNTYFTPRDLVFDIVNYDLTTNYSSSKILTSCKEKYDGDFIILQTDPYEANYSQFLRLPNRNLPVMFVNDCHSDAEMFETIYDLLLKNILNYSSSIVIMMPTSSEECDGSSSLESLDSNDYVQVSENHTNRIHKLNGLHNSYQKSKGFRLVTKGKHLENDLTLVEIFNRSNNENGNHIIQEKCDKYCQVCQNIKKYQIISTDTTQDRPCCCPAKENGTKYKRLENYISEIVTPMILTQAVAQGAAVKLPCESVNSTRRSCITCVPPRIQDNESLSCLCKGKKRKMKGNNTCPCEPYKIPSQIDAIKHPDLDKSGAFSDVVCRYKAIGGNKKNKNAICECPEELEPHFKFDAKDWIDETKIRKIKSDLTQTVSGFKLNIPRKKPESDNSFEELLKHFVENAEQNNLFTYDTKACSCNEKSLIKQYPSVDCECPYETIRSDEDSQLAEEPFQGIKFHIGGKGSDSKGLSGLLCFQLLQGLALSNSNFRL